jgi:hypothetical protein
MALRPNLINAVVADMARAAAEDATDGAAAAGPAAAAAAPRAQEQVTNALPPRLRIPGQGETVAREPASPAGSTVYVHDGRRNPAGVIIARSLYQLAPGIATAITASGGSSSDWEIALGAMKPPMQRDFVGGAASTWGLCIDGPVQDNFRRWLNADGSDESEMVKGVTLFHHIWRYGLGDGIAFNLDWLGSPLNVAAAVTAARDACRREDRAAPPQAPADNTTLATLVDLITARATPGAQPASAIANSLTPDQHARLLELITLNTADHLTGADGEEFSSLLKLGVPDGWGVVPPTAASAPGLNTAKAVLTIILITNRDLKRLHIEPVPQSTAINMMGLKSLPQLKYFSIPTANGGGDVLSTVNVDGRSVDIRSSTVLRWTEPTTTGEFMAMARKISVYDAHLPPGMLTGARELIGELCAISGASGGFITTPFVYSLFKSTWNAHFTAKLADMESSLHKLEATDQEALDRMIQHTQPEHVALTRMLLDAAGPPRTPQSDAQRENAHLRQQLQDLKRGREPHHDREPPRAAPHGRGGPQRGPYGREPPRTPYGNGHDGARGNPHGQANGGGGASGGNGAARGNPYGPANGGGGGNGPARDNPYGPANGGGGSANGGGAWGTTHQRDNSRPPPPAKCFTCGALGHKSRNCPDRR